MLPSGPLGLPSHSWMHTRNQTSVPRGGFISYDHDDLNFFFVCVIGIKLTTWIRLISHSLSFSNILEELPITIRTNALSSAFFSSVTQPAASQTLQTKPTISTPSFAALDFVSTGITRSLEQISDAVDAYRVEEGNLAYHARQNARERAKVDAYIQKRKEENAARLAQGLPPLPEEDVNRLFKIPPEPSRLESMLLLAQIDAYAGGLESAAGTGLLKMYAAKASAGI
jgi:translation initiation factor 3 subunit H